MTPPGTERDAARRTALLAAYDEQLRELSEVTFAVHVDRDGPLVRAVYPEGFGFVTYRTLAGYDGADDGERLSDLIARTIRHFAEETDVSSFEWKTRSHDRPAGLEELLQAHGMVAEEAESVMVGEAELLAVDCPLPDGVRLRRVGFNADGEPDDPDTVRADVVRVLEQQRAVFGSPGHMTVDSLLARVVEDPDAVELWVAQAIDPATGAEQVVTSGRLVVVPGTEFAGIWGGGTLPQWRQRGIYRALTAARARSALAKGYRYLQSDSTDYSKRILERSGFVHVTSTTPYSWSRGT